MSNGAMAQEECLCRSSNLYPCLASKGVFGDYYGYHWSKRNYEFSDRVIYTPGVTVFKTDDPCPELMPEQDWFEVDVITCAAPYQMKGCYVNPEYLISLYTRRIRNIMEVALDNQADVLILGAFGCGAFNNDPRWVAQAFYNVLIGENYCEKFKGVEFAIKPTAEYCPNYYAFLSKFSDFIRRDTQIGELLVWPTRPEPRFQRSYGVDLPAAYHGKEFSVLSDSISTLEGYNPPGYNVFYRGEAQEKSGVKTMADTWWQQVIRSLEGELLVNNSWSGSRATRLPGREEDQLFPSACSPERTAGLHLGDVLPDVILIAIGFNDWGNGVPVHGRDLSAFDKAYKTIICSLRKNYPKAELWCCTMCESYMPDNPFFRFPHKYAGVHIEEYNEVIRTLALKNQCRLVDVYRHHVKYATIDGSHPTVEGMTTLAELVKQEVRLPVPPKKQGVLKKLFEAAERRCKP